MPILTQAGGVCLWSWKGQNRSGNFWFEHAMYLHCYLTKFIGVIMIICLSILAHGLNLKYAFRFIPNKTPLLHWYDLLMTKDLYITALFLYLLCLSMTGYSQYLHVLHPCKSHDHDHQWTDLVINRVSWLNPLYYKHANHMTMTTSGQIMPWSDCLKTKGKREHKVARLVWDFDCLHFAQYILISPHGIDCKQSWHKESYHMDRVSWLNPLY